MTIEIIPAGASAVVTEKSGHHHDHHGHDGDRYRNHDRFAVVERDIKDARYDIVNESASNFRASTAEMARGFAAAATAACKTDDTVLESKYDINRETAKGFTAAALAACKTDDGVQTAKYDVVRESSKGFTAAALAACESDDKIRNNLDMLSERLGNKINHVGEESDENFCALQKQVSDSATSTLIGFKDLTALSYQIEGRSLLEAAKNSNYLAIQIDKNSAAIQVQAQTFASQAQIQAQTFAAASMLQAEKLASAGVLLATQIAAQAAKEAAECCCELKELIRADGEKTRDLIDGNEKDRLRERAQKAEQMLAAYYAAKTAPTVP